MSSIYSLIDVGDYQLIINKTLACKVDRVTNLIQHYVPECSLTANMEMEIIYTLPAGKRNQFGSLFSALNFQKQNLKLISIKITNSTLGVIYPK